MFDTYEMKPAPRFVVSFLAVWHILERILAVIAFTMIGVLVFSDVFGREFIGPVGNALGFEMGSTGIYGAQKMSIYLLAIGAFTGLGVSVATGSQIVPRVAFKWVPESWGPWLNRLGNLVSGLIFFATAYYGFEFVKVSREIGTVMAGLDWPAWVIQAVIPLGFASAGFRYLAFAIWPATAPVLEENPE